MKNKKITIYEYKNGKIKEDKFATFVNNNSWAMIIIIALCFIIAAAADTF